MQQMGKVLYSTLHATSPEPFPKHSCPPALPAAAPELHQAAAQDEGAGQARPALPRFLQQCQDG